jgi:dTDP-4-dehydrorhamnose reductase
MKILVLGSDGQLGKCLYDQLKNTDHDLIFFSRLDVDISDFDLMRKKMLSIKPDLTINAAAYTAVDKAQNEKKLAYLINSNAVEIIANICKELNTWLLHISTDYVFDGSYKGAYKETCEPNPKCVYGASKLSGEHAIQSSGCRYIIIRTSWVFSEYGNNFLKTMIMLGKKNKEIKVVEDQFGCPTYAQDIAKSIVSIAPKLMQEKLDSNIYHYCGDNSCSWHEFSELIFNVAKKYGFKVPIHVNKIKSKDYKTAAIRPNFSILDCSKIKEHFEISQSDWLAGINHIFHSNRIQDD